jgi:hypothetical protein
MNDELFVKLVREYVMKGSVKGVISTLVNPPGRRPASEIVELSRWYHSLSEKDREMIERAFAEVSHAAVFSLFVLLDGEHRVDDEHPPGELELWHQGAAGRTRLDGDLHDILNSEPWHG